MSYDENRISDLIDGGLKKQEESIQIDYAIYGKVIDKSPLIRYDNLKQAKDDYLENDYSMIVCEVSEVQNDGSLLIKQERVIKAPQIWLPANRFIPNFNDYYLCYINRIEECGNEKWLQDFEFFIDTDWNTSEKDTVTHWMIVEDPNTKLILSLNEYE